MNLPATRYEWEKCSRTVLLSGVAGGSASLEVEAGGCVDDVERVVRCRVVHSRLVAPETVAVELADIASARKLIDLLSDTSSLRALPERLRGLRPVWSPGSLEDGSFVPVDPAAEAVDDAAAPAACDADGFPIPTPRWVAFPTLAWVQRRRALEQQRLREAQEEELLRARAAAQTQRLRVVVPGFVAAGAIGADGVVREAAAAEAPCRTASVVSPSGTAAHVASPVDVASAAVAEAAAAAAASPEETQKRSRAEAALVVNEEEAARRKRARVEQQNRQRETALEEESAEETRRQERERLRQSEELQQQNEALLAKLQRQQQEKQEKKDKERAEREVAKLAKAEERRQRQEYLDFSKRVQQQQQKQRRTRRSGGGGGGSSAPYDKEVERAFEKQIRLDLPGSTDALVERSRVQYRHYREVVCAVVMHLRRLPAAALEDPQPHLGLLAEYLKLAGVYAAEVIDNLPSLLPRLLDASPSKAFPYAMPSFSSAHTLFGVLWFCLCCCWGFGGAFVANPSLPSQSSRFSPTGESSHTSSLRGGRISPTTTGVPCTRRSRTSRSTPWIWRGAAAKGEKRKRRARSERCRTRRRRSRFPTSGLPLPTGRRRRRRRRRPWLPVPTFTRSRSSRRGSLNRQPMAHPACRLTGNSSSIPPRTGPTT